MSRYLRHIIVFAALLLCHSVLFAQGGEQSFLFLNIPNNARWAAMGGGGVALYNDNVNWSLYNPASLSEKSHNILSLNYSNYLSDVNIGAVSYARNVGKDDEARKNHIAFGINYLDYGKFQRVSAEDLLLGSFSAKDIAINVLYSRDIAPCLSAGVNVKPFFSFYDRYSSMGMAFDLGMHLHLDKAYFNAGLAVRNIGWQFVSFRSKDGVSERERVPLDIELGISQKLPHAPFRFSLTFHNLQRWNLGYERAYSGSELNDETTKVKGVDMFFRHTIWNVEILPTDYLYFVISYNHRRHAEMRATGMKSLAGFSAGAGLKVKNINIDIGVASYQVGSLSYNVSLAFGLADWGVR